jgi:hypothetical protein
MDDFQQLRQLLYFVDDHLQNFRLGCNYLPKTFWSR